MNFKILLSIALLIFFIQIAAAEHIPLAPTDSDSEKLTILLQTINNEGWNQSAVDAANVILSNKSYSSGYWNTFFSGFFSRNPFTNNLSSYLIYPVFGWFDDDVHRNLQNGLTEPLKSNILRITNDNPNLGNALQNNPLLFQSLVNSNKFLDEICQRSIVNSSVKQGIFTFYKNYILAYPQYYNSAVTVNAATQRFLSVSRTQVYLSFIDAAPLTQESKGEIASALGLQGKYKEIFTNYSVLVIDNNGLDAAQLDFIDRYISEIPTVLYDLDSITVFDFIGNSWDDNHVWYSTKSSINIFGVKIGSSPQNQFPDDISPGTAEIFCSALAHEFNHIVDWYSITSNPVMEARKNALIDAAGTSHMNYLRSMVPDGVFFTSRQEFFASISGQWFTNSSHVLDLGISRFSRGYKDPINQFIFFADVYSAGSGNTLFYTTDRNGAVIKTKIPVFRDTKGHINKILVNNFLYNFTLDNNGNVIGIDSKSSLTLVTPNGGDNWKQGLAQTIRWSYTGSPGSYVKIELLKGTAVNRIITTNTSIGSAGSGSKSWTVPYNQVTGTDYKVRVTSLKNVANNDTSNANFIVSAGSPITVSVPNGGDNWKQGSVQTIRWSYTNSPGSYIRIELLKGTAVNRVVISNTSIGSGGSGSMSWTVPYNQVTGTDYKVRVTSLKNVAYNDTSNANFIVSAGAPITVTNPNGGNTWQRKSSQTITWSYTGSPATMVKIELLKGTAVNRVINASTSIGSAGSGSYRWTVPTSQTVGTDYKIQITSTSNAVYTDKSNANFTISV